MGRHSIEGDRAFERSLALFALRRSGILILPLLAGWGMFRLVEAPAQPPRPHATSRAPATRGAENPSGSPALRPAPLGILQVLNGSSTPGLGRAAADRLRALGYGVVAVKKAAHHYDLTTVFYQPGVEGLAGRVAAAVGATKGGLAPASLNASVPVTVVIGDDYRG